MLLTVDAEKSLQGDCRGQRQAAFAGKENDTRSQTL